MFSDVLLCNKLTSIYRLTARIVALHRFKRAESNRVTCNAVQITHFYFYLSRTALHLIAFSLREL